MLGHPNEAEEVSMAAEKRVPVSERALIQRLNRKMWHDDLMIRTTRGGRAEIDLGRHYVLNWRINGIAGKDIDLEDYGREFGVLQPYEYLAD
jgi:hypothetical protein